MPSNADALRQQINKAFGQEVVVAGSSESLRVRYLPTGLLPIDALLQGGLPRGRMIEINGNYSTLKSYIGLHAIKTVQQAGGLCALVDSEHAYDPKWAKQIGVDTKKLIIWPNPDSDEQMAHSGEEAMDIAEVLILNKVDLVVIDSVTALLPEQEQGKRLHKEKVQPGRLAALMSTALRKLTAANSQTAVLWINQLREQIGISFGNPEKATGGRALGFYASMRMNIRRAGKTTRDEKMFDGAEYKNSKVEVAQTFVATMEKNKLNKPGRQIFFDFKLEDPVGIDGIKFLFSQGVQLGIIEKEGTQVWRCGDLKVRGKDSFLASHDQWATEVEAEVRKHHGLSPLPGSRVRASQKAAGSRKASSARKVTGNTRARAQGASRSTGLTKKKSLK